MNVKSEVKFDNVCTVKTCFLSHPVHIQTHKSTYRLTNQTKLKSILKSAAQLLYSPVLVFETDSPVFPYVSTLFILQRLFHHHFR